MKILIFLISVFAAVLATKSECLTTVTIGKFAESVQTSERKLLNNDNVLLLIGPWLIKFYADWCPHCRHLQPIWNIMAEELCGDESVYIGQVNMFVYLL